MYKKAIFSIGIVLVAMLFWDSFTMNSASTDDGTFRNESDFDAYTGATTAVSIVPSDYSGLEDPVDRTSATLTDAQVKIMVDSAIALQGGFDGVISKGDQVMIKVNLVGANEPSGTGENTDYRVVKGLMQVIHEYTEGDVEIIIAEGTARTNDDPGKDGSVWHNSGYVDLLTDTDLSGVNFSLLNINQTYDDLVEMDLGDNATAAPHGGKYMVHNAILAADVYISVPVLKIHNTGITNALKNQIGIAPGSYYGYNKMKGTSYYGGLVHDVDQRRWTTEEIVDLCNVADIDFVVVDALMCLETYKTDNGGNRVRMNTVIAGVDPVAVDHVCAKIFCLNPDDIAHVTLAEKMGLGTNNRDKIYVHGASIEDVRKKVQISQDSDGLFGQSNRTWVISESFPSTGINTEYIESEATFIPAADQEGWSEPIYFFDDRIDLLSYFNGADNIVSYAFTYFDAPQTQTAELVVGSDEAMWVYLNGELVHNFSSTTTFSDGDLTTHKKDISINKGENSLLVKTLHKYSDYSFTLNICDPETAFSQPGNRVEGLYFYPNTELQGPDTNTSGLVDAVIKTIKAYPNPCTEQVHIITESNTAAAINIAIYDMQGRIVKTITDKEYTWNLSSENGKKVPAGHYLIKDLNSNSIQRLIVQ